MNIARALMHNSDIMIADEPAASLDNKMSEIVMKEITGWFNTVIVVTHNSAHLK